MRALRERDPRSERSTDCLPDDNQAEVATVGLSQINDPGFTADQPPFQEPNRSLPTNWSRNR
jgi:hypothetical protein